MEQKISRLKGILNAVPFPIVFVDRDFVIQYLNKAAEERYYHVLKYADLPGTSLLKYHKPASGEKIKALVKQIAQEKQEVFLKVNQYGERVYVVPVFDEQEQFIGFFERFEKTTD